MKWNDVELVDGKFYVVEVERWSDGRRNEWLFAYKENENVLTKLYVCAKMFCAMGGVRSIYDYGHICTRKRIVSIRPATPNDMDYFWDYLDRWGYKYSVNTKKLRHVGGR